MNEYGNGNSNRDKELARTVPGSRELYLRIHFQHCPDIPTSQRLDKRALSADMLVLCVETASNRDVYTPKVTYNCIYVYMYMQRERETVGVLYTQLVYWLILVRTRRHLVLTYTCMRSSV